jgi:hypothetical protein
MTQSEHSQGSLPLQIHMNADLRHATTKLTTIAMTAPSVITASIITTLFKISSVSTLFLPKDCLPSTLGNFQSGTFLSQNCTQWLSALLHIHYRELLLSHNLLDLRNIFLVKPESIVRQIFIRGISAAARSSYRLGGRGGRGDRYARRELKVGRRTR